MQEEFYELCGFIKTTLKDKIDKVILSNRLDSSPCVLVASKFGWSANMERIMKAQAGADARAYEYMRGKGSMEINPSSKIIQCLLREVTEKKDVEKVRDAIEFMYQAALITSGYELDSPQEFAMTIYNLIEKSLYK